MRWNHNTPGIPEDLFVTGDVPMTKTEIRIISIAKLRLNINSTVLDIGCGTGSVTVEAALQCRAGRVVAIDRDEEAVALTRQNVSNFGLTNVEVIQGKAPEDLPDTCFDRIFIGGSGADIDRTIQYAYGHLNKNGIIVVNTIIMDNTYKALQALEQAGFEDIECICLNVSRGYKVAGWMMKAMNPIYVMYGIK